MHLFGFVEFEFVETFEIVSLFLLEKDLVKVKIVVVPVVLVTCIEKDSVHKIWFIHFIKLKMLVVAQIHFKIVCLVKLGEDAIFKAIFREIVFTSTLPDKIW